MWGPHVLWSRQDPSCISKARLFPMSTQNFNSHCQQHTTRNDHDSKKTYSNTMDRGLDRSLDDILADRQQVCQ